MEVIEKNAGYKATKLTLMENGKELGFLVYRDKKPPHEDYVEVLYLRVSPSYRRRGYGKLLMNEFFKRHSSYIGDIALYATANYDVGGLSHIEKELQIPQENLEAFYISYGFKKISSFYRGVPPMMKMTKT